MVVAWCGSVGSVVAANKKLPIAHNQGKKRPSIASHQESRPGQASRTRRTVITDNGAIPVINSLTDTNNALAENCAKWVGGKRQEENSSWLGKGGMSEGKEEEGRIGNKIQDGEDEKERKEERLQIFGGAAGFTGWYMGTEYKDTAVQGYRGARVHGAMCMAHRTNTTYIRQR